MPSALQRGTHKETVSKRFLQHLLNWGANHFNSLNKLASACVLNRVILI